MHPCGCISSIESLPINKAWVLLLPLLVKAPSIITISILHYCKVALTLITLPNPEPFGALNGSLASTHYWLQVWNRLIPTAFSDLSDTVESATAAPRHWSCASSR